MGLIFLELFQKQSSGSPAGGLRRGADTQLLPVRGELKTGKLEPRSRDCWLHCPPPLALRVLPDSSPRLHLTPTNSATPPCQRSTPLPPRLPGPPAGSRRAGSWLSALPPRSPSGASPRGRPPRASLPPPPLQLYAIQPGEAEEQPERDRDRHGSHPASAEPRRSP